MRMTDGLDTWCHELCEKVQVRTKLCVCRYRGSSGAATLVEAMCYSERSCENLQVVKMGRR